MNPTHWLLAAFAIVLVIAIAAMYIASTREAMKAMEYRTADGGLLEADVQALQQQVPSPRHRVRAATYNLTQVAAQAVTAALKDMGTGKRSKNPHGADTAEHAHWDLHYQRVNTGASQAEREAKEAQLAMQKHPETTL